MFIAQKGGIRAMVRKVQEMTVKAFFESWYGKPKHVIPYTAWYDADMSIESCEPVGKRGKYRLQLSDASFRIVEAHCIVFIETY